jgi:hypothetical protein
VGGHRGHHHPDAGKQRTPDDRYYNQGPGDAGMTVLQMTRQSIYQNCVGCGKPTQFTIAEGDPICHECEDTYITIRQSEGEIHNGYSNGRSKPVVYKRINIPEWMRWEVFIRDRYICQRCGSKKCLTVDHIIPVSKGGRTYHDNLQTLCRSCNSSKGAK